MLAAGATFFAVYGSCVGARAQRSAPRVDRSQQTHEQLGEMHHGFEALRRAE